MGSVSRLKDEGCVGSGGSGSGGGLVIRGGWLCVFMGLGVVVMVVFGSGGSGRCVGGGVGVGRCGRCCRVSVVVGGVGV